jgi:hypothetical protein
MVRDSRVMSMAFALASSRSSSGTSLSSSETMGGTGTPSWWSTTASPTVTQQRRST